MGTTRNIKSWIWATSLLCTVTVASAADTSPPSLVIHDEDITNWDDFSLENTLQAIVDTNVAEQTILTTAEDVLSSMLDGLSVTSMENEETGMLLPNENMTVDDALYVLDNYTPIALFNRTDTHASDWSNCGEHRIVYEFTGTTANSSGRFWLIFEAVLPNPLVSNGAPDPLGCAPVIDMWRAMDDADASSRGAALQQFFYTGRGPLGPVVTHGNYSFGGGQVRTNGINFGGTDFLWRLHEFRTDSRQCDRNDATCLDGSTFFRMDTVKGTAISELFNGVNPNASDIDSDSWENLVSEWALGFGPEGDDVTVDRNAEVLFIDDNGNDIPDRLEELLAPELLGTAPEVGFSLSVEAQFTDVLSSAALDTTNVRGASDAFKGMVQKQIDLILQQDDTTVAPVTAQHVLTRAATQSCIGCHAPPNQDIAPNGVQFPSTNDFTHVELQASSVSFSAALTDHFFPTRDEALSDANTALIPFRADMNRDGVVDGVDIGMFFASWDDACDDTGAIVPGDMNGDCVVNGSDVGHFLSQWGNVPTVPEGFARTGGLSLTVESAEQAVRDAITPKQRREALDALFDLRDELEWARQQDRQGHSVH